MFPSETRSLPVEWMCFVVGILLSMLRLKFFTVVNNLAYAYKGKDFTARLSAWIPQSFTPLGSLAKATVLLSKAEKSYRRGGLSTVDLRVLASLDQLLFIMKILFTFFYKTTYPNEKVNCTELSLTVSIPCPRSQGKHSPGDCR
jgi:hypothetical protein